MTINIPKRNYLTFTELQQRWQCSENDLSFAIICGELKPSLKLDPASRSILFEVDAMGDWEVFAPKHYDDGYDCCVIARDHWYFLQDARQISPFDCEFRLASDTRNATKFDIPYDNWYLLPKRLKLDDVKKEAVFLMVEITRYEEKNGEKSSIESIDKPLGNRERDTLLTIIAALCKDLNYDYTKSSKTADLIQDTADKMGFSIGKRTIDEHLKKIPNALATRIK